jgi:hypothetical protein
MFAVKTIPDEIIDARINSLKKIYLVITVISVLAIVYLIAGISKKHGIDESPKFLIGVAIYCSIYYGLKKKRKWVVPFVLIYSAFALLRYFSNPFTSTSGNYWTFQKLILLFFHFAIALFYVYQIYFFSKKEVRESFGIKGFLIFS